MREMNRSVAWVELIVRGIDGIKDLLVRSGFRDAGPEVLEVTKGFVLIALEGGPGCAGDSLGRRDTNEGPEREGGGRGRSLSRQLGL